MLALKHPENIKAQKTPKTPKNRKKSNKWQKIEKTRQATVVPPAIRLITRCAALLAPSGETAHTRDIASAGLPAILLRARRWRAGALAGARQAGARAQLAAAGEGAAAGAG